LPDFFEVYVERMPPGADDEVVIFSHWLFVMGCLRNVFCPRIICPSGGGCFAIFLEPRI
jgi:hypothetical protein